MSSSPPISPPESSGLFSRYRKRPDRFDECLAADGSIRPAWAEFLKLVGDDPRGVLKAAGDACRRAVLDHEVNLNVYSGSRSDAQPWPLDVVPLLVDGASWDGLAEGLCQRARLYDKLLEDLYGPRRLLSEGAIPAALAMGNPGFLRPVAGAHRPGTPFLHTYAADVARSPDGRWWVLEDRLDAPAGLGYALQNRIIVRQVLPDAFQKAPVVRLYRFFQDLRASYAALSGVDAPRIVFLTPGAANEVYFEHRFLARFLGYPLVEGDDLTTRGGQVYLRTVGGLRRVDAIVRRVDSEFCDPLELDPSSFLGVPGLVHAVHSGKVALSNALGARALETTGMLAFLPPLARRVLGEELALPSAGTWWCGQAEALKYVLANLETLVIKPAFPGPDAPPVRYGALLGTDRLAALADEIRAHPWAYCGQERVFLGTTPAWDGEGLAPVPFVLRVFLTWVDGAYRVLPGGLARFHPRGVDGIVSLQQGSVSKDTWILRSDAPAEPPPPFPVHLTSSHGEGATPSRLADHLFWLGRYHERASHLAALLDKLGPLLRDEVAALDPDVARDAVHLVLRLQDIPTDPGASLEKLAAAAHAAAADPARSGGLSGVIGRILRILDVAKSQLPPEAPGMARRLRESDTDSAGRVRTLLAALDGVFAEGLIRDAGWIFLDLGRRIERALQLLGLFETFFSPVAAGGPARPWNFDRPAPGAAADGADGAAPEADFPQSPTPAGAPGPAEPGARAPAGASVNEYRLQTLLHLGGSLFSYRTSAQGVYRTAPVIGCFLVAGDNPRAVRFQADRIEEHLRRLPDAVDPQAVEALRTAAFRLMSRLRLADPEALAANPASACALARELVRDVGALSDRIGEVYFAHVRAPLAPGGQS